MQAIFQIFYQNFKNTSFLMAKATLVLFAPIGHQINTDAINRVRVLQSRRVYNPTSLK
jgi:hypothetical protein